VLGRLPSTLDTLFDYLATDVLARQPVEIQRFLVTTSVLRQMDRAPVTPVGPRRSADILRRYTTPACSSCPWARDLPLSPPLPRLFASQLGLDAVRQQALHRQAAAISPDRVSEETIYHLLEAGTRPGAEMVEEIGPRLVEDGRLTSLTAWMQQMPDGYGRPTCLDLLLGDILRLKAQFDEALPIPGGREPLRGTGDRLGRSRALRGPGPVYLTDPPRRPTAC